MNNNDNPNAAAGRNALGAGLIVLWTFAVYWPSLKGGFVWDDLLMVQKNPLVTGEGNWNSIWFQVDFPLTTFALWVEHLFWGENPVGYRAVNVMLHALNALLVWRVLARLNIRGAWLGGIFFAVHPVCVASAAWISELKNTLSLAFFLLSFLWWLRFESQRPAVGIQRSEISHSTSGLRPLTSGFYWLSLGAFVLALMSKTSTVMLPVVLLAVVWWRHSRITRRDLRSTIPFFAFSLIFGLATVWIQKHKIIGSVVVQDENIFGRLAGAGMALWFYLGKALVPVQLSMIYPRWNIDPALPMTYLPLLLWVIVLGAGWKLRHAYGRHILFALGCFTGALFPVLGFFDMYFQTFSRVSDHFQYLPLICIVALIAAALNTVLPGKITPLVATPLIVVLSVLTFQRAKVFATDEKLWTDTLAKNPAAWNAHNNLGCIRAEQGRMDEALGHFHKSLELNPRNTKAIANLAKAKATEKKFAEAEADFQTALKIKPDDTDAHALYGAMLAKLGRNDEATLHLAEAVRIRPEVGTRLELAVAYRATGKIRESIEQCRLALRAKPDHPEALSKLAWLLATAADGSLRDGKEAVVCAERACAIIDFKNAEMLGVLAAAYAESGQFGMAAATARKAVDLARAAGNSQFAEANEQLARLYASGQPYREPLPKQNR